MYYCTCETSASALFRAALAGGVASVVSIAVSRCSLFTLTALYCIISASVAGGALLTTRRGSPPARYAALSPPSAAEVGGPVQTARANRATGAVKKKKIDSGEGGACGGAVAEFC